MTTLYDCALNGVTLSGLDSSIRVTDLQEEAPVWRTALSPAWDEGQQLLRRTRESLSVTVCFAVLEPGLSRRSDILQRIYAWAEQGGTLMLSDRPGQQLQVICTALPAWSAEDYLTDMTLRFTSVHIPWWESAAAKVTGTDIMTLQVPGNAPCAAKAEVIVFNRGTDTIRRLKLHCGLTEMVFEGIEFPAGSVFSLLYRDGTLLAWIDGESVLRCRTADSADDLLAPCGEASTVYADGGELLEATFMARGRYV